MVFGGVEMMFRRGGCSKEKRKKERPLWSLLVGRLKCRFFALIS